MLKSTIKDIYLIAAIAMFTACNKSPNTYQTSYVEDDCEYSYSTDYPQGIDEAMAALYTDYIANEDYASVVSLMDSLVNANVTLDFWCSNYYRAMKETMPYDSILPRLMKVQEHEPSNPAVYSSIGYTYHHLGDTLKSLEYFHKGLDIASDNSNLWYGLGIVTLQNGDTLSAINHFTKSLDLAKKQDIESQVTLSQFMLDKLKMK